MISFKEFLSEGADDGKVPMTGSGFCSVCKKTGEIKHIGDKESARKHVKVNKDHFLGYSPAGRKVGDIFGGVYGKNESVDENSDTLTNPLITTTIDQQPETPRVPDNPKKRSIGRGISSISTAMPQQNSVPARESYSLMDFSIETLEAYMETKEFAEMNELHKKTLTSYIKKAADDAIGHAHKSGAADIEQDIDTGSKHYRKAYKRVLGINRATSKLVKEGSLPDGQPAGAGINLPVGMEDDNTNTKKKKKNCI